MKIRIEFDNIDDALSFSRKLIESIKDGKLGITVSGISSSNFVVPDSDKCGCYHSGYCWCTKERYTKSYCGGRKSRCTFYKKGF